MTTTILLTGTKPHEKNVQIRYWEGQSGCLISTGIKVNPAHCHVATTVGAQNSVPPTTIILAPPSGAGGAWVKKSSPQFRTQNIMIDKKLQQVITYVNNFFVQHSHFPDAATVHAQFPTHGQRSQTTTSQTFEQLFTNFIKDQTHKGNDSVSLGTVEIYKQTYNAVIEYSASPADDYHQPTSNADINIMDKEWIKGFKEYLSKPVSRRLKSGVLKTIKLSHNTINLRIVKLKVFLHWAIAKKDRTTLTDIDVKAIKTKEEEPHVIFLTHDQIKRFMAADLTTCHPSYTYYRACALFQCFTSLRHSDIDPSRWDITPSFLKVAAKKTMKTQEQYSIPIEDYMRDFLAQYLSHQFDYPNQGYITQGPPINHSDTGVGLPPIDMNEYNRAVKQIALIAGLTDPIKLLKPRKGYPVGTTMPLWQLISSHVFRATFICRAIAAGVQHQIIMKMAGLKNYRSLQHYIAVADETITSAGTQIETHSPLYISHKNEKTA